MAKKKYLNNFSILFGILCVLVVYMHSGWIGGFDIYTFSFDIHILRRIVSLLLMSVVPAFFILWGYLSNKYFYTDGNFSLRKKLMQFYPLYLSVFIFSFLLNFGNISKYSFLEIIGGLSGVYYRSGFYGGNIYLVVLFVIFTVYIMKNFQGHTKMSIIIFLSICIILTKILPHESTLCYVRYFGYYTAFFVGVFLKEYSFFEKIETNSNLLNILLICSFLTPFLNMSGLYFVEIQYLPNSPEHLLFTLAILSLSIKSVSALRENRILYFVFLYLSNIGNKAYFHFMVHALVIHSLSFTVALLTSNTVLIQIIVFFLTSYITVFVVFPVYDSCSRWLRYQFKSLLYW